MIKKPKSSQDQEIVFPDEIIDVISALVKKYNFEETEKKMEKEIATAKTLEGRKEIFENLPTCQISRIVKEVAEKKISEEKISPALQERLNIPKETAEKLSKELKEKVLASVKEASVSPVIFPLKKPKKEIEEKKETEDSYREPIE